MWQIENAVREVLALDIDSGFRCKEGACTCPIKPIDFRAKLITPILGLSRKTQPMVARIPGISKGSRDMRANAVLKGTFVRSLTHAK